MIIHLNDADAETVDTALTHLIRNAATKRVVADNALKLLDRIRRGGDREIEIVNLPPRPMSGHCCVRGCPEIGEYMLWQDNKPGDPTPVFFCREHISRYHSVSQAGETLQEFLDNRRPEVQYALADNRAVLPT